MCDNSVDCCNISWNCLVIMSLCSCCCCFCFCFVLFCFLFFFVLCLFVCLLLLFFCCFFVVVFLLLLLFFVFVCLICFVLLFWCCCFFFCFFFVVVFLFCFVLPDRRIEPATVRISDGASDRANRPLHFTGHCFCRYYSLWEYLLHQNMCLQQRWKHTIAINYTRYYFEDIMSKSGWKSC